MDPASLLAQLRDIQAPEPISWWPPAIGWWLLALMLTALTACAVISMLRYRRRNAWRRAALQEWRQIRRDYEAQPSAEQLALIVQLLRRSLASVYFDEHYLSMTGEHWHSALQSNKHTLDTETAKLLAYGLYHPEVQPLTAPKLNDIEKWIRRLKRC